MISDAQDSPATIESLCAMGVKMSIDGFGTDCSSLSYLRQPKVVRPKIDRSCVRSIGASADGVKIARVVTRLGNTMQLQTFGLGGRQAGTV